MQGILVQYKNKSEEALKNFKVDVNEQLKEVERTITEKIDEEIEANMSVSCTSIQNFFVCIPDSKFFRLHPY